MFIWFTNGSSRFSWCLWHQSLCLSVNMICLYVLLTFLLVFMAPVTLSFAINHRICYLQDRWDERWEMRDGETERAGEGDRGRGGERRGEEAREGHSCRMFFLLPSHFFLFLSFLSSFLSSFFPPLFFLLLPSSSIIPTSFFPLFFLSPRAIRAFGCTLMMGLSFANVSIGERLERDNLFTSRMGLSFANVSI